MDEIQKKLKKLAKGSAMRGTDASMQYKGGNSPTSDQMGGDMPPPPDEGKPINISGVIEDGKTLTYVGTGGDKESAIADAMQKTNTELVEWGEWDKGRKSFKPSGTALEVDRKGELAEVKGDINVNGKTATFTRSLTSDVKGRV